MRRLAWTLIILISAVSSAWAVEPGDHCTDHYGRKVGWVMSDNQTHMAEALYRSNGAPQIHYNRNAASASGLSDDAQKFLYYRECARLVLGHLVRPGEDLGSFRDQVDREDCWAANKFYYAGETDKLKAVEMEINELDRAKWVHIAGPVRKLDLENTCRFKTPQWPN